MKRVVSLLGSATEMVCALGFEGSLVGRSHECDYPPSVRRLPALTEPRWKVDSPSAEVDRELKSLLDRSLSIYRVDAQALRELKPDVILTQTQCEVCAVTLSDVRKALADWTGARPLLVALEPCSLADVWDDIGKVAAALDAPRAGAELVAALHRRMEAVALQAMALGPRPRVACVEWLEPLMAAGNWMPELVEMAGGWNLFGEAGKHSPWLEWEVLRRENPDILLLLPCGFDIERTLREVGVLTAREGWSELSAVRSGRVFVLDGNRTFNRPGPRLAESLEIVAELLHPGAFAFGHEGSGWRRLA